MHKRIRSFRKVTSISRHNGKHVAGPKKFLHISFLEQLSRVSNLLFSKSLTLLSSFNNWKVLK